MYIFDGFCVFLESLTERYTNRHTFTFSTTAMSTKPTNVFIITKQPTLNTEINRIYIFAGEGIMIALFLFVIVLQLFTCKRANSTRITTPNQKTCKQRRESNESLTEIQLVNEHADSAIRQVRKQMHVQQQAENDNNEYHEINQSLDFLKASLDDEGSRISSEYGHSYSPIAKRFHLKEPNNEVSSASTADLYLQPVSVMEKSTAITD